ncbi:MAG TPA: rhomboid family intramembrane serine protease [Thermoanaerobaculia bacterium]|jgi:rhomboid protease GluP|nr:rhomboid family intramembrane serine protease [Thermoanaerobaculia bacterium]
MRARRRTTPATFVLMGVILAGFAIEILTGAWKDPVALAKLGAIVPALVGAGQYWRLLTAVFLHGDGTPGGTLLHLAVNLFSLFQLGRLFELMFSSRRMVLIFFLTGIAASITSFLRLPAYGSSVGASGAVFGVMGAFIFSVRRSPRWRHDPVARSIVRQCIFWTIANIIIGLSIPQIDNAAHIGGLVAGALLGMLLPQPPLPPPPPAQVVIDV